jgi:hypothetical protein
MQPPAAPPPAPQKKSNALMIVVVIVAAVLSLCCCSPGIYNLLFPIPYTSTTNIFGTVTEESGTMPSWYGVFCFCAALLPWIVVVIVALVRRPKK